MSVSEPCVKRGVAKMTDGAEAPSLVIIWFVTPCDVHSVSP